MQPIRLEKAKPLVLAKSIKRMRIGLGWDVLQGNELDLDVTAVALLENGKVQTTEDVCFYGQLVAANGSLVSKGDDRTGGNSVDGDDEEILVDFSKVPSYVAKIDVLVTTHEASRKNHNFGLLRDAYAKIYNDETGEELYFIDLDEAAGGKTSVHVATLTKKGNVWSVERVDNATNDELFSLLPKYGVPVA